MRYESPRSSAHVIVPEDVARNPARVLRGLARAAICHARALYTGEAPPEIARRAFRGDDATERLIMRATSVPAGRGQWGHELQRTLLADMLSVLSATSAGAALLDLALPLTFNRAERISLPTIVATPAAYVKPGQPVPVKQFQIGTPPAFLEPRYVPAAAAATREMIEAGNAQTVISDALARSIGLGLDAVLFDAVADDGVRPSGLRVGTAASTASNAPAADTAALEDVDTLVSAVASVAGNTPPVLVAHPGRAVRLRRYLLDTMSTILSTAAVAHDDVLCVAPAGVAYASDDDVEISVKREAAVHTADPAGEIVTAAGVASAPVMSVFQTDSLLIAARMQCTWARRHDAAVSWLTATGW